MQIIPRRTTNFIFSLSTNATKCFLIRHVKNDITDY